MVESDTNQTDVIAFLSEPRSYGSNVDAVERHDTHGAIVFLAGDRAFKLKRAVKFPYMDYSTIELRRQMCVRELTVNQRLAPELYIEVCPIISHAGTLRFGRGMEDGEPLDWVVVMRRFDQGALLENMRRSGGLTAPLMRGVGETIARFHAEAEVTRGFGGEAAMQAVIAGNAAMLKSKVGQPYSGKRIAQYESVASSALSQVADILDARRERGHVRRCHGDLHLNNICLLGARPVLFDAIEFNDQFACIDVLYDVAFLLMDLEWHKLRGLANTVFNRYLELSNEHAGLAALPMFLSCRAAVRSHTTVAKAETCVDHSLKLSLLRDATTLLDSAVDYFKSITPRLIAIGGLSGTGKSTLARALAPLAGVPPGAVIIRSDVIRKQLMGVAETVRLPESAYGRAVNERVYEGIVEMAAETLASGYSVIADAVYGKENERQRIADVAGSRGARFSGLWLEAPTALLERRLEGRRGDASDATPDVLRAQLGLVTVPSTWKVIDAGGSVESSLAEARHYIA